ncbi:MAG: hypothetical protein J7L88_02370 [Thermoplasmata archaeon]|nr:hypothetical protein [Thermoplasmata archaeon]
MKKWAVFIVFLLFLSVVPGVVADVEPNDSMENAEVIGAGTISGSVQDKVEPPDVDYYRVEIPEHKMLKVNATAGLGSTIEVWILNENGDMVDYTTAQNGSLRQLWYDKPGGVAYIKVAGNGTYTLKVYFDRSLSEELEDVLDTVTKGFTRIVMVCVAAIILIIVVIGVIIILVNRSKKQNVPPPGAGLPPQYPGPQYPSQ